MSCHRDVFEFLLTQFPYNLIVFLYEQFLH